MAGLLDFMFSGQGGGLFGGMQSPQAAPQIDPNMFAARAMGNYGGELFGGLRGALDQIADPQGQRQQQALENYLKFRQLQLNEQADQDFMKGFGGGTLGVPNLPVRPSLTTPPGGQPQQPQQPQQPISNFGNAISGIESGGKYDALGPVIKSGPMAGDRAYGKYQVMGTNVGPWTKEVLGQSMTPEQFAANPQAQEAVFQAKFGQLAQKYGPDGAARAWFAGEKGMNNPNARDQLGTTVASYGQKFNAGLGQAPQQQPPQMAQAPGAPAASPTGMGANPQSLRDLPLPDLFRWLANRNLSPQYREVVKKLWDAKVDDLKVTDKQKDYLKAQGDKQFADFVNPPSFGDTGARNEYDQPIQGWRNANRQSVTDASGRPIGGTAEQPKAPIELVTKLRTEVQGQQSYKRLAVAMPVYNSMVDAAGSDDRGADLNLIYGFATVMDPDSVVRGEEMTMVKAIATLPDQIKSEVLSQMKETGRLSPTTRASLMKQAHSRVSSYRGAYDQIIDKQYSGLVDRYRMNRADVLPDFGELRQYKPPAAPVRVTSPAEARKLPSGTPIILPDGSPGKVP